MTCLIMKNNIAKIKKIFTYMSDYKKINIIKLVRIVIRFSTIYSNKKMENWNARNYKQNSADFRFRSFHFKK